MATKLEEVSVRLDPKQKAQLQREANSQHRSLSNYCAIILMQHCDATAKPSSTNGHDYRQPKVRATT